MASEEITQMSSKLCEKWLRQTILLIFFLPCVSYARQPALFCEEKIGNTFVGGCDVYYSSRQEAANELCGRWIASGQVRYGYPFFPTGPVTVGDFFGNNRIVAQCPAAGINILGYLLDHTGGAYIRPECPIVNGVRPYPNGIVESEACDGNPAEVTISGPSATKALPAGPALLQTATVLQNGAPVAGKAVTVSVQGAGGSSTASGVTDGSGNFQFTYLPPTGVATQDTITASCADCSNAANKRVDVTAVDESCPREAGDSFGNPIIAASVSKRETAQDYAGSGPHPLSLTRYYASNVNFGAAAVAGLGGAWTHNWAGSLSVSTISAVVTLGDSSSAAFSRVAIDQPWVPNSGTDALVNSASSMIYTRSSDESRYTFETTAGATPRLATITQRNGWVASLAYNSSNRLASVTNAFGRVLSFTYNGSGQLASVVPPDGQPIGYTYDGAQRLASARFADQTTHTYHYEDGRFPQALTGVTHEDGVRYSTFSYNAYGQAVRTSHAGSTDVYAVTEPGVTAPPSSRVMAGSVVDPAIYKRTLQVTDPLGNQQTWVYQGGDGQVRVLGASQAFADGRVANRSFSQSSSLPASETDFLGVQTMYTWDLNRQLKTATTQAAGRPEAQTSSTQWHPTFRLPALVTDAGRTTAYTYDALGNKLSEIITDTASGQVRTWAWTYTAQNLVDSATDPMGRVTRYAYDAQGNRISSTNALNQLTRYTYDISGRLASQVEPNGLATTYAYDLRGRLVQAVSGGQTANLQQITNYTYHPTGQLASVVQPSGLQVSYSYDAAQRLIAAQDNRGNRISYTLDAMGNRVREETRDQNNTIALATGRVINQLNRVANVLGAQNQTTALGYDANGQAISQTDPLNQTTRQTLDGLKRSVATTFADNASVATSYNQLDQLTQVTDPKGIATSYTRNAFGEVMTEASPDIGTIGYQRNAAGEVTAITDAKGNTTSVTRDSVGRPLVVTRNNPINPASYAPHVTTYAYDSGNTGAQTGYLARVQDPSGSIMYQRDSFGRILVKTQTVNDNPASPSSFKTSYTYDSSVNKGLLASITYPSGFKVIYSRSASGQIIGISTLAPGNNKPITPFVSGITHTALGQPKAWVWASGDSATRAFDADGRMTSNEFAEIGRAHV